MRTVMCGLVAALLLAVVALSLPVRQVQAATTATETVAPMTASDIGIWDRAMIWVFAQQRDFHRRLTGYLRTMKQTGDTALVWSLIGASFLYGVFHAAGPGHGKAVMTSYLLTHRQTLRRGVVLAVAAAFCQGLVAIVIVYGLVEVAGWLPRDSQTAVSWSERASFALVAVLGAVLLFRAGRSLLRRFHRLSPDHHHDHGHAHGSHDAHCGHTHVPSAGQVSDVRDIRTAIAVVLSIGIRPCTGAVIVLVFANVAAMPWAGVGAVLAMSAGTALAVASLAALAVGARRLAQRYVRSDARYLALAADAAAVIGGALILAVGLSLLSAAFGPAHPLLGA